MNNTDRNERRKTERRFIRHAHALRRAAGMSCLVRGESTAEDANYFTSCTIVDPGTGAAMTMTREFGYPGCELPIPFGERAVHLTVATHGAMSKRLLAVFIAHCFHDAEPTDLVWSTVEEEQVVSMEVFVLCNERWKPIAPPAWMRAPAANDVVRLDGVPANDVSTTRGVA